MSYFSLPSDLHHVIFIHCRKRKSSFALIHNKSWKLISCEYGSDNKQNVSKDLGTGKSNSCVSFKASRPYLLSCGQHSRSFHPPSPPPPAPHPLLSKEGWVISNPVCTFESLHVVLVKGHLTLTQSLQAFQCFLKGHFKI